MGRHWEVEHAPAAFARTIGWFAARNASVRRIRPHAEGGALRREMRLPNLRSCAVDVA